MYKDITGIILSGGKSTRMGENKSFLKLGNSLVIEQVTNLMKSIFYKVIIITNEPELYEYLQIPTFEDIYKEAGPIAGIHSGLTYSETEINFIISCDIPLMNSEMINSIIEFPSDGYITVAKADGFIQQLCGVYHKSILLKIEELITNSNELENREQQQAKRKCMIHQLLQTVNSTIIENINELSGYRENLFLNMNKPVDYELINEIINT